MDPFMSRAYRVVPLRLILRALNSARVVREKLHLNREVVAVEGSYEHGAGVRLRMFGSETEQGEISFTLLEVF
jgi:hypothetical protein